MPTKTTSITYPARSSGGYDYSPGGGGVGPVVGSLGSFTFTRTRTGTALPNWRTIIAAGGNATTDMTARWDSGYVEPGHVTMTYIGLPGNANALAGSDYVSFADPARTGSSPTSCIFMPAPAISGTFSDNMARAKFYKALRKEAVQFSAPTFLGELRETIRMIKRPASALYGKSKGYLDAVSKEKRRDPKNWSRALGGLWLEHAFGWLPLINDGKEAAEALARLVTGGNRKSVISGSFSHLNDRTASLDDYQKGYLNYVFLPVGFNRWRARNVFTETVVTRYKAKITKRVGMTTWDNMALFGFTPSELVPTAWELLPWSFLVDYFTNVGDILTSAVTETKDVAFINKTVITRAMLQGKLVPDADASRADFSIYCKRALVSNLKEPEWELHRKNVYRSSVTKVPIPTLTVKLDLGSGQLGNIAALLTQARALHPQNRPRSFRRV